MKAKNNFFTDSKRNAFTLIDMIVVIVVIAILATIVLLNISSYREEAKISAMIADARSIQIASDQYQLKYFGSFPVQEETQPVLGTPGNIDFKKLHPSHLRDLPQHDHVFYQVDYTGKVYHSTVDNPVDFTKGTDRLTWTPNKEATSYTVYKVTPVPSGKTTDFKLTRIDTVPGNTDSLTPDGYDEGDTYLISLEDKYGFDSAPVGEGYEGSEPFRIIPTVVDTPGIPTQGNSIEIGGENQWKMFPQITDDGKFVTWTVYDDRDGSQIGLKNLATGESSEVTSGSNYNELSQITPDGRYIVWTEFRDSPNRLDVLGKDLRDNKTFVVSDAANHQMYPEISDDGRYVVWQDIRNGGWDIYAKDLVENREFIVSNTPYEEQFPKISSDGRYIMWHANINGNYEIHGKDLVEGKEFVITGTSLSKSYTDVYSMSSDGRYVVWEDSRNGGFSIYGKDLVEDREFILTNKVVSSRSGRDYSPKISDDGKYVTWEGYRNGIYGIYGKSLVEDKEYLLVSEHGDDYPEFSRMTPDGKFIVYAYYTDIAETIVVKNISDILKD